MGYPAPDLLPTGDPVCSDHWHNIYKKHEHTHCEIIWGINILLHDPPLSFLELCQHRFLHWRNKDFTHKTQKMLFGISFTLCISCILTKSLKILLAFRFDPKLQNVLKSLYKPIRIIFTCTGIQGVMCTLCLTFAAPAMEKNVFLPRVIFLPCKEGSILAFGTMLGYIAILAFICFIFAFKGRKLPENYNEAKFITFGMLIYFIAWITFIPIDATTFGKYLSAVEIIVILTSNYGILCCTFFPKCCHSLQARD